MLLLQSVFVSISVLCVQLKSTDCQHLSAFASQTQFRDNDITEEMREPRPLIRDKDTGRKIQTKNNIPLVKKKFHIPHTEAAVKKNVLNIQISQKSEKYFTKIKGERHNQGSIYYTNLKTKENLTLCTECEHTNQDSSRISTKYDIRQSESRTLESTRAHTELKLGSQTARDNLLERIPPNLTIGRRFVNPSVKRKRFTVDLPSHLPLSGGYDWKHSCLERLQDLDQTCSCNSNRCDCFSINVTSIPEHFPPTVSELHIAFSNIEILTKDVFSNYRSLKSLDLSCNKLRRLEADWSSGLSALNTLDISNNFLDLTPRKLPNFVFEHLKSLKVLRIDGNGDLTNLNKDTYPDEALASLTSLEELHLDGVQGKIFGPGFRNMTSLRKLILSSTSCDISSLSNSTFENVEQITFLDLSGCRLWGKYLETGTFLPLKNLRVLNVSRNQDLDFHHLGRIMWGLKNSSLHTLRADSIVYQNSLNELKGAAFEYCPPTMETFIARWNSMLQVDLDVYDKLPKKLKTIDMRDTTVLTNIYQANLSRLTELKTILLNMQECPTIDPGIRHLPLKESLFLSGPKHHLRKKRWTGLVTSTLRRVGITVLNPQLETILDINSHVNSENNIEELDLCCAYMSEFNFLLLTKFHKLKYLTIRGISVSKLKHPESHMTSVKVFRLQSQRLEFYLKNTLTPFSFLPNLVYLDLSMSQLSFLREDLFQGLDHLEYLYLDQNLFSQFNVDIFKMTSLKLLNLSNTALFQLPMKVRSFVDRLRTANPGQVKIDMSGCPIQCDCYNLDFLKWMVSSGVFDPNFSEYKCKYPNTSIQNTFDGYKDTIRILEKECAENYPMFLLVLGATMVLVFAAFGAVIYRLRWKIRYLYYAAYLKLKDKKAPAGNKEYEFDIFLSYDAQDAVFVKNVNSELEKRGFKLLIHSRDFVAGDYIASNIVKAVSKSRKTLVVLTRKLLASTWCNYEIQMATMESVQTGRQVLVFLLKESIPNKELGVELLRYIRSNTYLPYPSQEDEGDDDIMNRFYEKLAHDLRC